MFHSNGLLSQIATVFGGRGGRATQLRTHREAREEPLGKEGCTALSEEKPHEHYRLDERTASETSTPRDDRRADSDNEEVPPWFGWFP
jgi:hypothetical protein